MATRTLDSPPSILPLYARAALPLIPGASLLPFVPGRGKEIPELELVLEGVRPDPDAVAAYARVCGFSLRNTLPPTYPHVLAFPLHMAAMADGSFPFGAVGLVHIENRIAQHRPIGVGEELKLVVRPTPLQPHKRGRTFSLLTEAWSADELAWESTSTMLHRGGASPTAVEVPAAMRTKPLRREDGGGAGDAPDPEEGLSASAEWRLGGDLGRRYAGVSGDRNPIHMHSLTAKPLGFPSAIAHGMWTKARCLGALGGRVPDAFAVEVGFRKPIRLPGTVEFLGDAVSDDEIEFAVRDAKRHTPHLEGHLTPLEPNRSANKNSGRKSK
jgi:MaoC like domain